LVFWGSRQFINLAFSFFFFELDSKAAGYFPGAFSCESFRPNLQFCVEVCLHAVVYPISGRENVVNMGECCFGRQ
jgi:hypothetical protein